MTPNAPDGSQLPAVGDLVAGKYRVVGILGEGGMGVVLDAVHEQLRTPVAVKLLRMFSQDPVVLARFLREARAAAGLQSDHVVKVFDVGTLDSGAPFMVLERLTGEDLAQVLVEEGRLSVDTVADYVLQACEGLAEAHAMGIVHRDLKPANLFRVVRKDGSRVIKILDFGISKEMQPVEGSLTATAQAMGSPYYMSPEQVRSAKDVDLRTDIWALGVIVHELLTRTAPFAGDTLGSVFAAIVADPPASIHSSRADVPPALERVIMRCLEKQAARRYANVGELARDLAPLTLRGSDALDRIVKLTGAAPSSIDALAATASQAAPEPISRVPSTAKLPVPSAESARTGDGAAPAASADRALVSQPQSPGQATGAAWGATQPSHAGAPTTRRQTLQRAGYAVSAVVVASAVWFGLRTRAPSPDAPSKAAAASLATESPPAASVPAATPAVVAAAPSLAPSTLAPGAAPTAPAASVSVGSKASVTRAPRRAATASSATSKSNEAYDDRQ